MPLVEHNDVIEAFPANRPDDAFGEGILPGRSRGDEDLAHPEAFHPPDEDIAVDRVPVAEQVFGRGLFREALDKLVGGPGGRGVVGGVDMDEFSPVVSKDQESEEQLEGEGGHDEEVDSDNLADVCLQGGPPRRGWPWRGAPHVLGNGEFGDLIAEKAEFGLDSAPAPDRVSPDHAVSALGAQDRAAGDPLGRAALPAPLKPRVAPVKTAPSPSRSWRIASRSSYPSIKCLILRA